MCRLPAAWCYSVSIVFWFECLCLVLLQQAGWVRELAWTRTGAQGNQWREAKFTIPQTPNPYYITIETVKGSNPYSDIAIDDISATPQRCPDPCETFNTYKNSSSLKVNWCLVK